MLITQKQFAVDAPLERVWGLLPRVVHQCLPLEKMDIIDEQTFNADLRWDLAFISLKLHIKGKFVDISPPSHLRCVLSVDRALLHLKIGVAFTLKPIDADKTEVLCAATSEGSEKKRLLDWALAGQQRQFAGNIFDSIRRRLVELCE